MKLRDLFVSIGFEVNDDGLKKLDQGLRQTKTIILALGTAAVAGAGMLVGMAKSVANAGDLAAKTADKLGVQIEALQELRYAAELSGIAQTNFDTGLQRMTRRAAEAARGTGEAKDALRALGVALTDGHGRMRKSEDLLADIADGMARVEDPSRRVALAFKLFDTEGVGMVNMLSKGGAHLRSMREEARQLGLVIGEQDARAAEMFQDELLRAMSVLTGIKNTVGAGLLPVMTELMTQFRLWMMLNREAVKAGIEKILRGTIVLLRNLYSIGRVVVGMFADMVEMLGGIERAAQMAAWALGLFAGIHVSMAIGNLTMGIMSLLSAFKLFSGSAVAAGIKVAWLPLLIGAAVFALILWFEDLYRYIQGDKSVFGVLQDKLEKMHMFIQLLVRSLFPFFALFTLLENKFEPLKKILDYLIERVETLRHFGLLTLPVGLRGLALAAEVASTAPAAAPAGNPVQYYKVPRIGDVKIDAPITITVPEGTAPEQVSRSVQQGISDGLARMLRDAGLATEPQVQW